MVDGASSGKQSKVSKLLSNKQLKDMTWAQVKEANTEYFNKHSHYDFSSNNKYNNNPEYQSNGIGGAIKKEHMARLISKEEWENARKKK